MSIQQTGPSVVVRIGYRNYNERSWQVACDYCGKRTERSGNTAGDAADHARFEMYCTVKTGLTTPLRWSCPDCQAKRIASGKASAAPKPVNVKTNGKALA